MCVRANHSRFYGSMSWGEETPYQIQCFTCEKWLSSDQAEIPLDGLMPYMTNYEYTCADCGQESLNKKAASFIQVGITALANLTAASCLREELSTQTFFDVETEIEPFVWKHWDIICTKRSKSGNWKANLSNKLTTETIIFAERDGLYGLVDQDLSTIGPRKYESKTVPTKSTGKVKKKSETSQQPSTAKKTKGESVANSRNLSHGYPLEHPYNKDGYRYILAERDPHSSIIIDVEDMAGRPIPPELYRPLVPSQVLLALHDRAPQLKISDNRLTVTGEKGYCMVRATHGVSQGTWYYEVHIDDMTCEGSAVRIGWGQSLANLQAPCGFDKLSYSWRSKKGTKFHQSRGKHFSEGYGPGDTVGFLLHLPVSTQVTPLPPTHKDKALIKFKNYFYFEEKDETLEEHEKSLKPLIGSKIELFKNGIPQGEAFTDILTGTYYPSISLYKPAVVTANFGPQFWCPPKTDELYCPMSDAAHEAAITQLMSEMLFHVESKVASRTTAQYPANYRFSQIT